MKTIKASELIGAALDWAVAKCDQPQWSDEDALLWVQDDEYQYNPSTDWSQGGPIIAREGLSIVFQGDAHELVASLWNYSIQDWHFHMTGPTPLIAAMRCYVASKLGDEVEIPEELL